MLSPALTTWRAQYERLARSYARVIGAYDSSIEYDDDLQHYFQDCWSLKDWIKNDPASGASAQIEPEVSQHRALRIAADLANGSKHLARHTHREGAYVTAVHVTVHLAKESQSMLCTSSNFRMERSSRHKRWSTRRFRRGLALCRNLGSNREATPEFRGWQAAA